jgi:hypothetical protein
MKWLRENLMDVFFFVERKRHCVPSFAIGDLRIDGRDGKAACFPAAKLIAQENETN